FSEMRPDEASAACDNDRFQSRTWLRCLILPVHSRRAANSKVRGQMSVLKTKLARLTVRSCNDILKDVDVPGKHIWGSISLRFQRARPLHVQWVSGLWGTVRLNMGIIDWNIRNCYLF